jgi:hypothetical protein
MATVFGKADDELRQVQERLEAYEQDHPGARAMVYRQNSASIRIRIIDERFAGTSKQARHDHSWTYVEVLPIEVLEQITLFLLLAPSELARSMTNSEFEDPMPSAL